MTGVLLIPAFALVPGGEEDANAGAGHEATRRKWGYTMIRSLLSLLLILIGLPLIAASLHGDSTVIPTAEARTHGLYAGIVLMIAGFVIGKFWSLNWDYNGAARRAREATEPQEPQQIDLFEPRNKA